MKFLKVTALVCLALLLASSVGWSGGWSDCGKGTLSLLKKKYDNAIRLLSKCIESGELTDKRLKMAYEIRGNAWQSKRQYDKAITDYDKAIELNPKQFGAYFKRGNAWQGKRQYDKAIADYGKTIELNPKHYGAYFKRGNAWQGKRQYDKAIADFDKAIELNPKYAPAYSKRGTAWRKKRQYDKAIADFDTAIELHPKNAAAYFNRGSAWYRKRQYDKAIADYSKVIKLNPNWYFAYNELARILATCPDAKYRNGEQAIILAQKAVSLKQNAYNFDTLAAAYAEAGRFKEAIQTQQKAVALAKKQGLKHLAYFTKHLAAYRQNKLWRDK